MNKLHLLILPLLFLTSCGTNHNDVMVAFYNAQGVLGKSSSDNQVLIAQEATKTATAYANAATGGVEIIDPESGFITKYSNPNPYLYGSGQVVKTAQTQVKSQLPLRAPVKQQNWFSKAGGYTLGIIGKTIDTALVNAVPYIGMIENNKTQRANYEYAYLSDKEMFGTMSSFGSNLENTALGAFASNTAVTQSALSEMKQTSQSAFDSNTTIIGHSMAAVRDMNHSNNETIQTMIENPLTNIRIDTNSNTTNFTEQYPDWSTWPTVTPEE